MPPDSGPAARACRGRALHACKVPFKKRDRNYSLSNSYNAWHENLKQSLLAALVRFMN